MTMTTIQKERLQIAINELVRAARTEVRMSFAAGAHQTESSYRLAREAEEALFKTEEALDRIIAELAGGDADDVVLRAPASPPPPAPAEPVPSVVMEATRFVIAEELAKLNLLAIVTAAVEEKLGTIDLDQIITDKIEADLDIEDMVQGAATDAVNYAVNELGLESMAEEAIKEAVGELDFDSIVEDKLDSELLGEAVESVVLRKGFTVTLGSSK